MSDEDLITAMRRKAGLGRPPPDVTAMSAPKALRLALAKAAEDGTGMVMQVTDVTEMITSITRMPDEIPEHSLLGLLEGPMGSYGLAVFSLAVTTSVVEQLTTGSVLKFAPEERNPTSTDSVMCFELMDLMLKNFEKIVAEAPNPPDIAGYKTAAQLKETRSIPIAFDDIRYRMFRISVDMGRGLRQGEIILIFPASRPQPKPAVGMPTDWEQQFQASVMKTEASLDTILHRVSLPLSQVAELQVGMTIPVPQKALRRIEVLADGKKISSARLGQMNGHRAIRLNFAVEVEDDAEEDMLGGDMSFGGNPELSMAGAMDMGGELPALGGLAGAGDETDFPAMGGDMGAGAMDMGAMDMGTMGGDLPDLPDLPSLADMEGDLPALGGDLPPLGGDMDLPPLGDMGSDLGGDFPAMGELPPLE